MKLPIQACSQRFISAVIRLILSTSLFILALCASAGPNARFIPHPLPTHLGNIFVAGESVVVSQPRGEGNRWRLVSYEGKHIGSGIFTDGKVNLGPMPVGWYKMVRGPAGHWTNRVSFCVLEPLKAPTPENSPIGIDVAMAWFFPDTNLMPSIVNICQLAGMNRVRDRLSWPEVEPERGHFAPHTRYDDSVRIQTELGLKVLDVNHISPPWADTNTMHFPSDLRVVHDFYRQLATHWRGKVEAIEPWNEADIKEFGGHMGSEMASLQKAAWLGLKAGNPDLIACQNVFAIHRASTLQDFAENNVWPYFDTFNLHHYDQFKDYPQMWSQFRAVSAGKPMWVTECNVVVPWKDQQTKEPDDANLRLQAERVPMIYSEDVFNGATAVFYFVLPHYVEYEKQFGLLRPDLTPRPAYCAAAAAGRFLAGARAIGQVAQTNAGLHGYVFAAQPDGRKRNVLVLWSEANTTLALSKAPVSAYDCLGREETVNGAILNVNHTPHYYELTRGGVPKLLQPPKQPKKPPGKPGTVVLQAGLPVKDIALEQSACRMPPGAKMKFPIYIYNFGEKTEKGTLKIHCPEGWNAAIETAIKIAPGERKEVEMMLTHPEGPPTRGTVAIAGEFSHRGGQPLLSVHLTQ